MCYASTKSVSFWRSTDSSACQHGWQLARVLSGGHNETHWQCSSTDTVRQCSVLGKELISLARRRGTKTINVVRRDEAANELKQLGCACCDCWVFSGGILHPSSLCFNMACVLCGQWSSDWESVH